MVVSRLLATVGSETEKIRLAVPARKLPRAALASSNQLGEDHAWLGLTRGKRFASAERVEQAAAGFNFFALPMLVYQLDAKLKAVSTSCVEICPGPIGACARIVQIKQSIGVRLRNPMIVDRSGTSAGTV